LLPAYDFSGKGDDKSPRLLAPPGKAALVLPDLLCFRETSPLWIEVKWKAKATINHNRRRRETGINRRLWREYQRVQEVTGIEVVLLFLHEQEAEIRADTVRRLSSYGREYTGPRMGPDGMVFWPYERIPLVGPLARLLAATGDVEFGPPRRVA
jgi:hypothetical protein